MEVSGAGRELIDCIAICRDNECDSIVGSAAAVTYQ